MLDGDSGLGISVSLRLSDLLKLGTGLTGSSFQNKIDQETHWYLPFCVLRVALFVVLRR